MEVPKSDAQALFSSGLNCSQAVFSAQAGSLGFDPATARRLASGFGAGMGRQQEVCGAVTGGILALGLRHGPTEAWDKAGKERVYALTRSLQERFAAVHGTVICRDLLGCDLQTAEGQQTMADQHLVKTICLKCVGTADRIVTELMKENP